MLKVKKIELYEIPSGHDLKMARMEAGVTEGDFVGQMGADWYRMKLNRLEDKLRPLRFEPEEIQKILNILGTPIIQ